VPSDASDFDRLIRAWRAGETAALGELFARYSDYIRIVVRSRLHDKLRPQYDSLDFVQDVWASVVALPADRYRFDRPADLVGFLTKVASNKVIEVTRQRFKTRRRDVNREEPLPAVPDNCDAALVDRRPSASRWVIGREQWERLVGQFKPGQRAILERLRDGYTHEEIAAMAGVCVRSVERIVHRLRELSEP
jgi:RNA polymerase sigma factor (sigma-70 family)